ncbi:MAG: purine-nucleoside phosphorylase [Helicobacteraceae bacterium]|nr:purine-nucleoside phosphorylase [Helicobacteraceae bacterium]
MFICAKGENFSFAREIGVGLVDSAISLTSIVLKEVPKEIIFIGSAGSYTKKIQIFDILTSTSATQIESSFINEDSYTPIDNKIDVSHETKIKLNTSSKYSKQDSKPNAILDKVVVNSSNYITTNSSISNSFCSANILLENMEFFSVLKVAEYFNIQAFGIFCITNYCDDNAHSNFLKNHKIAKEKLENYVRGHYAKYF